MGFKTVLVSNDYDLSFIQNQLRMNGTESYELPLEDISVIILENPRIKITNKLLNEVAKNNIVLFSCDDEHIPTGVFTPFNNHSRTYKIQKKQIELSEPFRKRIWQKIVIQKLKNQAEVLKIIGKSKYEQILSLSNKVTSGDKENKEAQGARIYFNSLFYNFSREQDNWINSALNYGYTILRGCIIRNVVASGFIPALGIHHCSELNRYNLADDLIEPFRPIVDLWVYENCKDRLDLTSEDKQNLINLVNYDIRIADEVHSIKNAIDKMITSFSTSINENDYGKIILPKIIKLKLHEYE